MCVYTSTSSQVSVIWSHSQVTDLMGRSSFIISKRSSQISFCYTRCDQRFLMINMLKMTVWCVVCVRERASARALSLIRTYIIAPTLQWMVMVYCHYRRLSGTCFFFTLIHAHESSTPTCMCAHCDISEHIASFVFPWGSLRASRWATIGGVFNRGSSRFSCRALKVKWAE